jgi:hypothetical protein
MSETKEEKKKSFEEKLVELHPKFLEIVRDVYPLAVLSSLCIAVTAFTQQTYPQIQPFSITAAGLFLVAFIASFACKIVQMEMLAFISYCSTALAVFMLVLVVSGFATTTPVFSKTMILIPAGFMIVILLSGLLTLGRVTIKSKLKATRLSCLASFSSLAFLIIVVVVLTVTTFVGSSAFNQLFTSALLVSMLFFTVSLFFVVFFVAKERKTVSKRALAGF